MTRLIKANVLVAAAWPYQPANRTSSTGNSLPLCICLTQTSLTLKMCCVNHRLADPPRRQRPALSLRLCLCSRIDLPSLLHLIAANQMQVTETGHL